VDLSGLVDDVVPVFLSRCDLEADRGGEAACDPLEADRRPFRHDILLGFLSVLVSSLGPGQLDVASHRVRMDRAIILRHLGGRLELEGQRLPLVAHGLGAFEFLSLRVEENEIVLESVEVLPRDHVRLSLLEFQRRIRLAFDIGGRLADPAGRFAAQFDLLGLLSGRDTAESRYDAGRRSALQEQPS